jgi:hypothetical protein
VNPIYINTLEPIHTVVGSLIANHLAWAKICQPFGMGQNGDSDTHDRL